MSNTKPLALTLGDPAGIGPEIVVKALAHDAILRDQVVVVGDALVLQDALSRYAPEFHIKLVNLREGLPELHEHDIALHLASSLIALPPLGKVSAAAGRAAYDAIVEAAHLSLQGHTGGMATAPINKLALRAAGIRIRRIMSACATREAAISFHRPSLLLGTPIGGR